MYEARGATKTERLIRSKPVNEELDTTLLLNHRGKHIEVPFSATIKPSPPRHRSPIDSVSITRPITWTLFSVLAGKRKGEVFPFVSKYTRYYRTRTITKTQMHFHHPGFKWLRQWCTIKTSNDRANILSLSPFLFIIILSCDVRVIAYQRKQFAPHKREFFCWKAYAFNWERVVTHSRQKGYKRNIGWNLWFFRVFFEVYLKGRCTVIGFIHWFQR